MAKCPICKGKINSFNKTKALDGTICGYCASLCSSHSVMQVEEISEHWKKNNERWNVFKTTQKLKNIMSGVVSIDTDNEMFVFCDAENKKKIKITPIVFKYNEVIRYEKEIVGERNVSKKKGTLTRAVVGGAIAGPVGAIVGAVVGFVGSVGNEAISVYQAYNQQDITMKQRNEQLKYTRQRAGFSLESGSIGENR